MNQFKFEIIIYISVFIRQLKICRGALNRSCFVFLFYGYQQEEIINYLCLKLFSSHC